MQCRNCGSTQTEESEAGHTICAVCGVQLADNRIAEVEYDPFLFSGRTTRLSKYKQKKVEEIDELLSFEEVIQRLLITQVNVVIEKFHVSPALYSTCQRFWIDLITSLSEDPSRCDQLFAEKSKKSRKTKFARRARNRVKPVPNVDNDDIDVFEEEQKRPESSGDESSESKHDDDEDRMVIDEDEDKNDRENEDEADKQEDSEEESSDEADPSSSPKRQKVEKQQEEEDEKLLPVSAVSFWLTLAILSFSLRWLRERFLVSDVVKWAQNGDIAYVNVGKMFFETKTTYRAYQRVWSRAIVPPTDRVHKLMKRIATLINRQVPNLNAPLIIERLSTELVLPSGALSCALVLYNLIPLAEKPSERLNDRAQVLAYLIIAMKLLYGFGDCLDAKMSRNFALYQALPESSLAQWVTERLALLSKRSGASPSNVFSEYTPQWTREDIRNYVEYCRKELFENGKLSSDAREMIRTFQELADKAQSSPVKLDSSQNLNRSSNSIGDTEQRKTAPPSKKPRNWRLQKRSKPNAGVYVPFGSYIIYRRQLGGEFHRSYVFFVEICARHVDVTLDSLHSAIQALEKPLEAKEKSLKQSFLSSQKKIRAALKKRSAKKQSSEDNNKLATYASGDDSDELINSDEDEDDDDNNDDDDDSE